MDQSTQDDSGQDQPVTVSSRADGEHLADQLLLPFALAGGGAFTAEKLNLHSRTNMEVIRLFLPVEFLTKEHNGHTIVQVKRPA